MTSWVVPDSGLLIATVFKETYSGQAAAIWEYWDVSNIHVAAPSLFHYEVVAAVRKHTYRGTITSEEAKTSLEKLLSHPVDLLMSPTLLKRAYALATQFNRPTAYDAQYLAVAEHLQCEFWTADEKLYNTVHAPLPWVKWIGNFTPPQVQP